MSLIKSLLSLFLCFLLILQSLPSSALNRPSKKDLDFNPEKALDITENFFDGKKTKFPSATPSLNNPVPLPEESSSRFLLASGPALDQAIDACKKGQYIHGGSCATTPLNIPNKEKDLSSSPNSSQDPSSSYDYPDSSKEQGKREFYERAQVCGAWTAAFSSQSARDCALEKAWKEGVYDERYLNPNEIDYIRTQKKIAAQEAQEREDAQERKWNEAYNNLSGAGKFGFWSTIALSLAVFTGGAALAGYFGALAYGGLTAAQIAGASIAAGLGGLLLGAIPTFISYDNPGGFHEVLGNTILTTFQIPYSILSGLLNFLSLGHLELPDLNLSPSMSKLHKATQKASQAVALAAGASLGLGAAGVPYLASAAAFIPSPLAIGAGIYAGAHVLYRGGKAIYDKIQDNKKQSQEKELEALSNEIDSLHEQYKSLRRELQSLGVKKLPQIETKTPRPPNNPGKNATVEERLLWNRQVKDYGQEFLKELKEHKQRIEKAEEAREKTLKRLKEVYPQETVSQGANNTFHYTIPSLLSSGKLLVDPKTAGLTPYGEAALLESQNSNTHGPLFSLWGPPRKEGIPVTGDYLESRGGSTHKGTDFGAPQGTAIVVSQETQVLFARNTHEHCKQRRCLGNRGDMVTLSYGHPTKEKGSFGMYTHLGWKVVTKNPDGTTKRDKNSIIQGQDEPNSGILVHEGETLEPYRIIGVVGNTGRVTTKNPKGDGAHLHYQHVEYSQEKVEKLRIEWKKELEAAKARKDKKRVNELNDLIKRSREIEVLYKDFINATAEERPSKTYEFLNNDFVQKYLSVDPVEIMQHP